MPQEKTKVLLVEDEKDMVRLLKAELEGEHYEVSFAMDGEEGYTKYLAEHPDLIILDIALPKLNGHELCRRIRRERKDEKTLILMLSACREDVDRIRGKVIGAQRFVTKPFKIEALLKEIKLMLSASRG